MIVLKFVFTAVLTLVAPLFGSSYSSSVGVEIQTPPTQSSTTKPTSTTKPAPKSTTSKPTSTTTSKPTSTTPRPTSTTEFPPTSPDVPKPTVTTVPPVPSTTITPPTSKVTPPTQSVTPINTQYFSTYTSPAGTTSQYHVLADNVDWNKPVSVIVRLHGDGALSHVYEFDSYKSSKALTNFAREASHKNAIILAPKSPDRFGHTTWWENMPKNDEWLTSLIENEFLTHPSIDKSRFYWMGYSGGSEFLSYHYVAQHPELMKGGVLMVGGGGGSYYSDRMISSSQTLRDVPMSWHVGAFDDGSTSIDGFNALRASQDGHDAFKRNGFTNVERVVIPGKNHYNVDHQDVFVNTLLPWIK